MRQEQEDYYKSRDKVTPPVRNQTLVYGGVGVLISFALRTFLDWEVNPADAEGWWNAVQSIAVPLIPAVTALFGSVRGAWAAREEVTPVEDPLLWDEDSNSWQPGVVRRGNPNVKSDPSLRRAPRRRDYPG
jgi:hypothetical protein